MIGALLLALSGAVRAQNCFFIPDADATKGTCNSIPMGQGSARYQSLVTAQDLGNAPRILREIAFAPCTSGTLTASRFTVRFAYYQGATLTTNFANNVGSSPTIMLNATNFQWNYTANQWSDLGLTGIFPYVPSLGNLVIDIEFEGASGGASCHRDTRQRVYTLNWSGTPPATGSTGSAALKLRLSNGQPCNKAAFTAYGKGCGPGPLTIAGTGVPQPSAQVSVTMTLGRSSSVGAYLIGSNRLALPLDAGGFTGCTLLTDVLLVTGTAFDAGGTAMPIQLTIPNDNNLLGVILNFSGVNFDAAANPGGLAVANAVEMQIGT